MLSIEKGVCHCVSIEVTWCSINPAMGWSTPGYHGYVFKVDKVSMKSMGLCYGPIQSGSNDMMHQARLDIDLVDDTKVRRLQILRLIELTGVACRFDAKTG